MTGHERHMNMVLNFVSSNMAGKNAGEIVEEIAEKYATGSNEPFLLSQEDQYILGAILGSMLHQGYCDGRKLPTPNENGLPNNPRLKKLTESIDEDFVESVKRGEIPQSSTLYIDKNGTVIMDIANTSFVDLSPHWKKENFMAGCAATRSILSNMNGLTHENPAVREYVEVAVANAIHEAWIGRSNVYYEVADGTVYTNRHLDTAYINLPANEQDKDLLHYRMARQLVGDLIQMINQKNHI